MLLAQRAVELPTTALKVWGVRDEYSLVGISLSLYQR